MAVFIVAAGLLLSVAKGVCIGLALVALMRITLALERIADKL